jgi:hypothetical protein
MSLLDRAESVSVGPLLDALDAVRRWILKRGSAVCAPIVRDRDRRVVLVALFAVACAATTTAVAPGYALLLGPVILGVPHLWFEARYLFFQHALLRRTALIGILVAQSALVFAGVGIYTLGLACVAALIVTGTVRSRRVILLLAAATLAQAAAIVGPDWSRFVLLHAHNCIPLVVWMSWRRRPTAVSVAVAVFIAAGIAAILAGAFDDLPLRRPFGDDVFSITRITDAVAAGFGGAWRHRFLLLFCFTQAVHYAIWLRLIPEDARPRATPRSWRASWKAFKQDSGPTVARLMLVSSLAVPLVALVGGVVRTRALYVTASEFHATVEVILIAVVLARRQRPPLARSVTQG